MQYLYRLGALAGVCGLLLGACTTPPPAPPWSGNVPADYIIGPGDALNVFVYRVPEFSVEVPVRPDGRISTPLVPDVLALGKTPTQLAAEIEQKLKKFVTDPRVTVMVTNFKGPLNDEIKVIGEVAQPLAVPYQAEMSVLDVMIMSKGLTRFAAGNRAFILRRSPDGSKTYGLRLDDLMKDGDVSQNVALQPGDTVFVPQAWF